LQKNQFFSHGNFKISIVFQMGIAKKKKVSTRFNGVVPERAW
jgi:hypothetical protein